MVKKKLLRIEGVSDYFEASFWALNSSFIFSTSTPLITGWKLRSFNDCLLRADFALSFLFLRLSLVTAMTVYLNEAQK